MQQVSRDIAPKLQERRWFQIVILLAALAGIILAPLTVYQIFFSQPAPLPAPYAYGPTVPGSSCDQLGGRWVLAQGTPTCLPNDAQPDRLQLSVPVGQGIGQVYFYGTKHLPRNYAVTVDVDGLNEGGCAGVITRNSDARPGGYVFEVCHNGDWIIGRYDAASNSAGEQVSNLLTGQVTSQSAYRLSTVTDGVSLRFKINNNHEQAAADGKYSNSDSVSLFVTPLATEESAANFQNFAFTEVRG
jgi:hypothetical protein